MRMVYIKCLDMTGIDFWAKAEELDALALSTVEVIGWLWSEDDNAVKVFSTVGHKAFHESGDHYSHVHIIPKTTVIEMKDLEFKKC